MPKGNSQATPGGPAGDVEPGVDELMNDPAYMAQVAQAQAPPPPPSGSCVVAFAFCGHTAWLSK